MAAPAAAQFRVFALDRPRKRKGLTVRQPERLTGLNRGVIRKA